MNYVPLNVKSHFSLLSALSKPKKIAERLANCELPAAGLTDLNNISGSVQYLKAMQDAKLKPLLGMTLGVCEEHSSIKKPENKERTYLNILAKNTEGWKSLINLTSLSNHPNSFYHKPRLSFEEIGDISTGGELIVFSGRQDSHVGKRILSADLTLNPNWLEDASNTALFMQDLFGAENFFLEVQLIHAAKFHHQKVLADCVRELGRKLNIPCVATPDPHYCEQKDSEDHKILLCRNLKTTLYRADKDKPLPFFSANSYHIPTHLEMVAIHTEEELRNTNLISDMISEYSVLQKPQLPKFPCPNGMDEKTYLRELCIKGWNEKIKGKISKEQEKIYGDRMKFELEVFEEENLSGYFLMVDDICQFMSRKGWHHGYGRGSAAGCLLSYMIGLTSVDSIKYDLLFERFFNNARRGSMPDFDLDVPVLKREPIIEYVKEKYGRDRVSQIVAFQTIKGKGALKTVFNAHNKLTFDEMNRVTKYIPEDSKIADELQAMKDAGIEPSILRWALENRADKFSEWCTLKDDDTLEGPLSSEFAQSMRLEGTKIAQSRHAAGIVIAPDSIDKMCPLFYEENNKQVVAIAGFEKDDLESIGLVKLDLLGIAALDKLQTISNILRYGEDEDEECYNESLAFTEEMDE